MNLEIGQVLWLKIKYKIDETAKEKHPMLIAKINEKYIEVIDLDKTKDKLSKKKLDNILTKYDVWHEENIIREERIVHMDKKDIFLLNPDLKIKEIVGINNKN